ncbi:LPXTG cell wall anchor domain-containing protein [Shimazuella sp. AN120528]|uniref:LPXTG cell wall anchor domain-containing protein n=1 Tax=Shimazuella soli TaxID=1892854 RepID=UPI001F100CDA|nr:LPXTG cell wall anchor domain-containing protein [Shimazuella soli]MCH5585678.1 LPXTG cell wall anchor domain-containing protein [Shimazuella soli]
MQKDPKRVLESLRIEEEDPLLHHRPRKFRKRKNELSQVSNTAVLSLCLVTGLSSGVGSAFANSLDGNPQNKAPLDEPPSKVEQNENVELPQMKVPQTKSSEITPNNPPLDEPASKVTEQQPNINENKHKHIEKGNSQTSEQQKKETAESKQNKEQIKPKESQTKQQKVQEKTPKNEQSTKHAEKEKPAPSHSSTEQKPKAKEKSVTPQVGSTHDSNEAEEDGSTKVNKTKQSDVLLPQTEEGGQLPQTAGNDLNQAALGAGVALAGAFLLRRKREKPE